MKYTMESKNSKTIEFVSKNGNKYTVILENNLMSLVDKWNNVIDGIQLNREQEHQLVKFIYDWYGENVD